MPKPQPQPMTTAQCVYSNDSPKHFWDVRKLHGFGFSAKSQKPLATINCVCLRTLSFKRTCCVLRFSKLWLLRATMLQKYRKKPTLCSHYYRFYKFSNAAFDFRFGMARNGGRSVRVRHRKLRKQQYFEKKKRVARDGFPE